MADKASGRVSHVLEWKNGRRISLPSRGEVRNGPPLSLLTFQGPRAFRSGGGRDRRRVTCMPFSESNIKYSEHHSGLCICY